MNLTSSSLARESTALAAMRTLKVDPSTPSIRLTRWFGIT